MTMWALEQFLAQAIIEYNKSSDHTIHCFCRGLDYCNAVFRFLLKELIYLNLVYIYIHMVGIVLL